MNSTDEVVINLSKNKIALLAIGSVLFVLLGLWLLTVNLEPYKAFRRFDNPDVVRVVAFTCVGMFGFIGLYCLLKFFDNKPGLVLNATGITDNSSAVAAGLIPWSEIRGFGEFETYGQKMLIVLVSEPEKYVSKGNSLKRALNRANFKMVGSPISISANTLKIRYNELKVLCEEYHQRYG